jgi:hypothetical protein
MIQELKNQLSIDNSLKILIPGILDRIGVLMEQIGTVKGLVHLKEHLEKQMGPCEQSKQKQGLERN